MDLRADADDAALVKILERVLADVGDIAGDLLGAELGVARIQLVFLEVDGGIEILAHEALVEEHGVLVVVALPGHEADEDVAAQGDLALIGRRSVGKNRGILPLAVRAHAAAMHALAHVDDRVLVDAGTVVGAQEFCELVFLRLAAVVGNGDGTRVHLRHDAVALGEDGDLGIHADLVFHAGADDRRLGAEQRNGLALHVRAHQGAVRVVVRQEGDHRRSDGDHHARGDIDIVHALAVHLNDLVAVAASDALVDEAAVFIDRLGSLADNVLILHIGGHVLDLIGHAAGRVIDLAERRLDKAVLVDAGVGRKVGDQADVRTFRRLDRAHTAVVAVVHVSDLHVRALAGKAAGAKRGEAALVRQLRERVRLIHELGERRRAEELLDRRSHRADVDQALRRHDVEILDGHALADDALHAGKADAELVLQQLSHAAQAAVAQVVDIVLIDDAARQCVHVVDARQDILHKDVLGDEAVGVVADGLLELLAAVLPEQLLEHAFAHALLDAALGDGVKVHKAAEIDHVVGEHAQRAAVHLDGDVVDADGVHLARFLVGHDVAVLIQDLARARIGDGIDELLPADTRPEGELLVVLVAADHGQVIAARIEEEVVDERLAGLDRGRLARAQLAVDLEHRFLVGLAGVLLKRHGHALIVAEQLEDLRVGLVADGADELRDGDLAVLVDADPEHLVGVGLVFEPRAAVRNDRGRQQRQIGLEVDLLAVIDAGGTHDLGDDHALGAVDDERAGLGHQREIPHEDLLLLDLAGLPVVEPHVHLQGRGIRRVARLALEHVVLGSLVHLVVDEAQLQVARVVGDRSDVGKDLAQTRVEEPLVGLLLKLQQVRHLHDLLVSGEILAQGLAVHLVSGHLLFTPFFSPLPCPERRNVLPGGPARHARVCCEKTSRTVLHFPPWCAILSVVGGGFGPSHFRL